MHSTASLGPRDCADTPPSSASMGGLRTRLLSSTVVVVLACWAVFLLIAKHPEQHANVRYQPKTSPSPVPVPLDEPQEYQVIPPAPVPELKFEYAPVQEKEEPAAVVADENPVRELAPIPPQLQVATQVVGFGITHHERFRGFVHLVKDWHTGWSSPLYLPELNSFLCTHPKAGCSTLRNYALIWAGTLKKPQPFAHLMLFGGGNFNREFIEVVNHHNRASKILSNSDVLRVAFVREPIGRVISMFISKLLSHNDNKMMRHHGVKYGIDKTIIFQNSDLQLPDHGIHKFIDELWKMRYHLQTCSYDDEHLCLQSCRCGHRFMDYDFVGKTETLDEDLRTWLNIVGRTDLIPALPPANQSNQTTSHTLRRLLTEDDIAKLWDIYQEDYVRFGYPFPKVEA